MGIKRLAMSITGLAAALALLAVPAGAAAGAPGAHGTRVIHATHWDTSQPLRDIPPAPSPPEGVKIEHRHHDIPRTFSGPFDPVVQSTAPASTAPSVLSSFEGIGIGDGYAVNSAPPDPNGAVGPNDYVEVVNEDFAVFNKSGSLIYGPVPTNTLWSGFGGGCQSNNDGDATVKYDQMADRWIISQFSVSTTPYLQCVAVSTTGDPTGSWNRFSFGGFGSNFPDYPKLGVWPDAYYTTFNLFYLGAIFVGPQVCAYDRNTMLQVPAQQASQQCSSPGAGYGSMLPSDLDGSTLPPSGSPNFLLTLDTNSLDLFKFHVDWATPSKSNLSPATNIPVASYSEACGGGTCIPQGGVSQQLDSLGDRLMYRLAYRNFGDHESLVVAHSVTAGSSVGVRWYELRNPNGTPTVYQQGTYAPDSSYRWMPSVAMDHSGDIALGFSISSSTTHPGIDYTGRLASDALGVMTQGEGTIITGAGSQNGGLARWGDYTSMAVDPSDDCTFWYTNQYLSSTGSFNWSTHVGTFKLAGCATSPGFTVSASPSSQTVAQGQGTSYTVTESPSNGYSGTVGYSVSGLPSGASATFTPTTTGGSTLSSTMSIGTASTTPAGTYTLTITGTDTSTSTITSSTTVTLVVTAPDFSLSASPSSQTVNQGTGTSYTVTETPSGGYGGTVSYSVGGLPSGAGATFNPTSTSGSTLSTTMSVATGLNTPAGSYTLTVTGSDGTLTHTATVTLVVSAVPQDFALAASPGSQSISRGHSTSYSVTVSAVGGGAYLGQAVSLSVSGLPNKSSASFSPNPTTSSSTLKVSTSHKSAAGTYTLTITGKVGTFSHSVTVTLSLH